MWYLSSGGGEPTRNESSPGIEMKIMIIVK